MTDSDRIEDDSNGRRHYLLTMRQELLCEDNLPRVVDDKLSHPTPDNLDVIIHFDNTR